MLGFLKWQFQGVHKSLTLYGLLISLTSIVAGLAGCPAPWPFYISIAGLVVIFLDIAISYGRFSYRLYRLEQDRIMRELERK